MPASIRKVCSTCKVTLGEIWGRWVWGFSVLSELWGKSLLVGDGLGVRKALALEAPNFGEPSSLSRLNPGKR